MSLKRLQAAEALLEIMLPRCIQLIPSPPPLRSMEACGAFATGFREDPVLVSKSYPVCDKHNPFSESSDPVYAKLLKDWLAECDREVPV